MARARLAALLLLGLAVSCGGGGKSGKAGADAARNDAPANVSALERAAIDAGIVADIRSVSPVGLYRNRHEAGLDSLCIVPDEAGRMRFGMEAVFGEGISCRGGGTLRTSGDKLIMNFARSACLVVARYEGDRIVLPGALDVECSKLCTDRGSLEGVAFPRVSREESVARDARAQGKDALCP